MSDEQWARLEPLLPDRTPIRGGRWVDHRRVVDGVLWRTRSGSAWRDLPQGPGKVGLTILELRRWVATRREGRFAGGRGPR
ncbi:transposase [Nakamurella sp. PAMC28650]|nr:transposase [Nakamurella sp. PAMC28650]